MSRALLFLTVLSGPAWGSYQSVTVPAGASLKMTVPSGSPFTALGDYRISFRLHDWTVPATGYVKVVTFSNALFYLFTGNILCAGDSVDGMGDYGGWECVSLSGLNDIAVRFQRFGNSYPSSGVGSGTGSTVLEVQDLGSGQMLPSHCQYDAVSGNVFPCVIDVARPSSVSGTATLGAGATGYSLAWLKWFSTTVPPGSPLEPESTPADLADWRFEGNYANQGTGGYAVTLGTQAGSPSFTASPVRPPACNLQRQILRAGQPAQLANYSYALDGGSTLTYLWQELSGPTPLTWQTRYSAAPKVSGGVFGSYVLQLTVADGHNQTSVCAIKDGFVATDANGVTVNANPMVGQLLGPQIQLGRNPWGWFDDRHVAEANLQIANLATYFNSTTTPFWNVAGTGTISVTTNSAVVTGSGTTFTTTFCQGPGNPSTPKSTARIRIWYPLAAVPGGTGRRGMYVASCQSDTQMTLTRPWNTMGFVASGSPGWNYSYDDDSPAYGAVWTTNAAPADFYDAVAGFYSLYYRSGIDDYLNVARSLADNFWQYRLDSGRNYFTGEGYNGFPRNNSLLGLILRALDGRPDMWSGLELVFNYDIYQFHAYIQAFGSWQHDTMGNFGDPREGGYSLAEVAYCALFDTGNPAQQAACRTELAEIVESGLKTARSADGNWYAIAAQHSSWTNGSSVNLTNGSTAATCNGSCGWQSAWFSFNLNGTNFPATWWFTNNPSAAPASNADGDPVAYYPTYVDATHMTLDRPYQGTTGLHGWTTGNGDAGFGVQPYMLGIMATALDFASQALACASPGVPTNCNDTAAGDAKTFNITMASFLRTSAYWPLTKAVYYYVGSPDCRAPINDTNPGCTDLNPAAAARQLSAEAMRGVMTGYANSGDHNLLEFGDTLYNAMWAKPGFTAPAGLSSDSSYIWSYNDGLGWNMTGAPPLGTAHKYFGMGFGIGAGSAWPGYRLGGAQTGSMVQASVAFNLSLVPNATKANLLVTYPTGASGTVSCAASPCQVSFDRALGNPLVTIQYLSAGGVVLARQPSASVVPLN